MYMPSAATHEGWRVIRQAEPSRVASNWRWRVGLADCWLRHFLLRTRGRLGVFQRLRLKLRRKEDELPCILGAVHSDSETYFSKVVVIIGFVNGVSVVARQLTVTVGERTHVLPLDERKCLVQLWDNPVSPFGPTPTSPSSPSGGELTTDSVILP